MRTTLSRLIYSHAGRELRCLCLACVVVIWVNGCRQGEPLMHASCEAFDQQPGQGWRKPAETDDYTEAGKLIDEYLRRNQTRMPAWQVRNLDFHAGQTYAFAGDYKTAMRRMENALADVEPVESPVRWNPYVRATIAFLKGDKAALAACREEMVRGHEAQGTVPNMEVVDRLIARFGAPYAQAYGAATRRQLATLIAWQHEGDLLDIHADQDQGLLGIGVLLAAKNDPLDANQQYSVTLDRQTRQLEAPLAIMEG